MVRRKVGVEIIVNRVTYSHEHPKKEAIYELYLQLGWNVHVPLSKEDLLKTMQQSWHVEYAYVDGKLVGTGRVVSDGMMNAYLCGLGVSEDYRRQGIGSEIMRRMVHRCKSSNLRVQFFCEEHLVPYYEKQGFKPFAIGMKL